MENIYAVQTKNYKVPSDTQIVGYFSTKEKAIDFCLQDFKRINPNDLTELLPKDLDNYKHYERFEYNSHYGNYPCAYELVPIFVQ